jgi:hypothetical protein
MVGLPLLPGAMRDGRARTFFLAVAAALAAVYALTDWHAQERASAERGPQESGATEGGPQEPESGMPGPQSLGSARPDAGGTTDGRSGTDAATPAVGPADAAGPSDGTIRASRLDGPRRPSTVDTAPAVRGEGSATSHSTDTGAQAAGRADGPHLPRPWHGTPDAWAAVARNAQRCGGKAPVPIVAPPGASRPGGRVATWADPADGVGVPARLGVDVCPVHVRIAPQLRAVERETAQGLVRAGDPGVHLAGGPAHPVRVGPGARRGDGVPHARPCPMPEASAERAVVVAPSLLGPSPLPPEQRSPAAARDQLTAQELQIAQLVAQDCPTGRSDNSCSCPIARSARTSTASSPSSGSPHAASSGLRCPRRRPNPAAERYAGCASRMPCSRAASVSWQEPGSVGPDPDQPAPDRQGPRCEPGHLRFPVVQAVPLRSCHITWAETACWVQQAHMRRPAQTIILS